MMNLPKLFEDRMRRLLGDEYDEYLRCYSKPHFGGIRVNTLKISPEEFERICPFSIKRIPWVANGYYYNTEEQPARHPYYYAGLYYIQEPSAMTPASLLPIHKGDKVLDICAAPGGKSTELGAKLSGEGLLVSNDISNSRAKALLKNIELFGIRNALVLSEAPNKLHDYFPEYFDKILIDAPCSGEGMFRKSPAIMKNWEQYGVEYYNKLQKEIIIFAAKMLKPGGMMLYSTCTFSPEENEGTISYLLEQFPEFHVVNAIPDEETRKRLGLSYEGFDFGKPEWVDGLPENAPYRHELRHCIRLWPHKINGEGHFITLLQKGDSAEITGNNDYVRALETEHNAESAFPKETGLASSGMVPDYERSQVKVKTGNKSNDKFPQKAPKSPISEEAFEFFGTVKLTEKQRNDFINHLEVRDDRIYMVPQGLPDTKGLRILRQGLLLGEMKKQRFEPAQALASALTTSEYDKLINLNGNGSEAIRYLKCEAIEPEGEMLEGWQLVCVDGHPLGWAKTAKNSFKNKYLPGWRWM